MRRNQSITVMLTTLFMLTFVAVQGIPLAIAKKGCGSGCGGGSTTAPLSDYEKQALYIAIDEEYKAKAIYQKVVDTFGPIEPFPWIIRDEQCHVNWVAKLCIKYGLQVPPDRWTGNVDLEFTSKKQSCEVGAQAEFENAAIYDEMIPHVSHDDLISTFTRLRDVSRYRHLPAFLYWASIYKS